MRGHLKVVDDIRPAEIVLVPIPAEVLGLLLDIAAASNDFDPESTQFWQSADEAKDDADAVASALSLAYMEWAAVDKPAAIAALERGGVIGGSTFRDAMDRSMADLRDRFGDS